MSAPPLRRLLRLLPSLFLLSATACFEPGGANVGESRPGNKVAGNLLGEEVILSEDGRYLVVGEHTDRDRAVWTVDLTDFASARVDVDPAATRMLFGADGDGWILVPSREVHLASDRERAELVRVSLRSGVALERWSLPEWAAYLSIDERRERLAVWTSQASPDPGSDQGGPGREVHVLDIASGDLSVERYGHRVRDVRFVPSTGDLAVVLDLGDQSAEVDFRTPGARRSQRTFVPNCASRLEIAPGGLTAMIAPVDCPADPVSVIDLVERRFVANLPGFGPVTYTPDGTTAVAFGRRDDLREVADIETDAAYSLLFIDVAAARAAHEPLGAEQALYDVVELGDELPIYSVTPDGDVVLLYSIFHGQSYDGITIVDTATRTLRDTWGPEVMLHEFVVTADGGLVYLIDGGLFRLDVATGQIEYVYLPCRDAAVTGEARRLERCNPDLVNLHPSGDILVLGWQRDSVFALYDIALETITETFRAGSAGRVAAGGDGRVAAR